MKKARYSQLLEEGIDLKRWYDNLARGSEGTAIERARVLCRFLDHYGLAPEDFVNLAKSDRRKVEDMLSDFVGDLDRKKKSPGYIQNYVKAVKSWLDYNEIPLMRKIKIGNRNATPTIEDEKVPTKDELRTLLNYANERCKSSIVLIAMSGLRPEVLGDRSGTDGLTLKDLPELSIEHETVNFVKTPTMVVVRAVLSKKGKKYFTFLGSEGCEYLKAYLEKRLANGEKLAAESPLIAVTPGYEHMGKSLKNRNSAFIETPNVTREIREAMRPRFNWRPYVLRAYFDTSLLLAESQGKIAHSYRSFFMGHVGDIEAIYTTNKGRLPENLIEDMRESYRRCLEYLQSTKTDSTSEETIKAAFKKQLLLVAGFRQDEIDGKDLSSMTDEEFQVMVRQRLLGAMVNNGVKQKVISVDDVEGELARGWEYVDTLPNGKAVLRIP